MSSTIEFNDLSANVTGQANFTIPANAAGMAPPAVKTVNIQSGKITVSESSTFCVTPPVIEISALNLSVSDNSNAHIGGSDTTLFLQNGRPVTFTLLTLDKTDVSQIQIDNLDFLGWAQNPPYPQLIFNFDTSNGPNFGKFVFPKNGNAFGFKALTELGYVRVNMQRVPLDQRRFIGDYTGGTLTLSLRNGTLTDLSHEGPEEQKN